MNKAAHIWIERTRTVTNSLATTGKGIRGFGGNIDVTGSGTSKATFNNSGIVTAEDDIPGLQFWQDVSLIDISAAKWNLAASGTGMQFDETATGLLGAFNGYCGSYYQMNAIEIRTCGRFTRNGCGVYLVGDGLIQAHFRFQDYSDGSIPSGCSSYTPSTATGIATCDGITDLQEVPFGSSLDYCSCGE